MHTPKTPRSIEMVVVLRLCLNMCSKHRNSRNKNKKPTNAKRTSQLSSTTITTTLNKARLSATRFTKPAQKGHCVHDICIAAIDNAPPDPKLESHDTLGAVEQAAHALLEAASGRKLSETGVQLASGFSNPENMDPTCAQAARMRQEQQLEEVLQHIQSMPNYKGICFLHHIMCDETPVTLRVQLPLSDLCHQGKSKSLLCLQPLVASPCSRR